MITISIDQGFFSAITLLWGSIMALAIVASAVLLWVALHQKHKQNKKGEKDAYRNY